MMDEFSTYFLEKDSLNDSPLDALLQQQDVTITGFKGPLDQEEPEYQDFTVRYEVARVIYRPEEPLKHDGVLGIASIANSGSLSRSFIEKLEDNNIIKTESFRFNDVFLNSSAEQYQSSITFGFTQMPSTSDYLLTANPIPEFTRTEFNRRNTYKPMLFKIGLKEVDILNYFDIADFDESNGVSSIYDAVIIDSAVPHIQLPYTILEYFDKTFFSDNCISFGEDQVASCG